MDIQMSLNKIADAIQVPLTYANGQVSGSAEMVYSPLPGIKLPVTLTIKGLFANQVVGVIGHVVGDLHIVVTHFYKTGVVSVFLVDGREWKDREPHEVITPLMPLTDVVAALRKNIVASFIWKDRRWSTLKLPN